MNSIQITGAILAIAFVTASLASCTKSIPQYASDNVVKNENDVIIVITAEGSKIVQMPNGRMICYNRFGNSERC